MSLAADDKKAQDKLKRQAARLANMADGVAQYDLFLRDLIKAGLLTFPERGAHFWNEMAARMVDTQTGGLAAITRQFRDLDYASNHWQQAALSILARAWAAVRAFGQLDEMPEAQRADLLTVLGYGAGPKEVLAMPNAERIKDQWQVVGRRTELIDDITAQYNWLYGLNSGRWGLFLNFAFRRMPIETPFEPGQTIHRTAVFFPSNTPQRLVFEEEPIPTPPLPLPIRSCADWTEARQYQAERRALNPWLTQEPLWIAQLVPVLQEKQWLLVDSRQQAFPLIQLEDETPYYRLLALSGGQPITVAVVLHDHAVDVLT
jgi:hypothetical protein